jgi:C-terminal processing protease CtpA/Prc
MFETLKDTQAIVFDMRGFPNMTAWEIAPRLTEENGIPAALIQRPLVMAPDFPSDDLYERSAGHTVVQPLPLTDKWRYKGNTVMLIDERAVSQPEHSGLFFRAANGTKFIGSPTAGADGDISNFMVPGGIIIGFSAQGVQYADGGQLQRIGLVPDIEVRPTIAGIQSGRDEVLEAAIAYLEGIIEDFVEEKYEQQ